MKQFGLRVPVVQAPMTGGGDTPQLVAAVCNAGGIGFIGAAYLTPAQMADAVRTVRTLTDRPFGINLFAPLPTPDLPHTAERAVDRVAAFYRELDLPEPTVPKAAPSPFPDQLQAALDTGAAAFSFTFGMLPPDAIRAIKARRMFMMGTATTVEEAVALERAGVDAVVAQGSEAGGHRGTFLGEFAAGMVGTISLVPQVVDAVRVPVVASGGIMDGRGVAAALALGAQAVQLGTAFLTCVESGVHDAYRDAILGAREDATAVTRAFSGRPARGIVNRFVKEVDVAGDSDAVLPFPLQNALTRPLRTAAAARGRAEFLSLWAGQGVRMARRQSAAELVARLAAESDEVIAALSHETDGLRGQ